LAFLSVLSALIGTIMEPHSVPNLNSQNQPAGICLNKSNARLSKNTLHIGEDAEQPRTRQIDTRKTE
jgi:hypothetical protein